MNVDETQFGAPYHLPRDHAPETGYHSQLVAELVRRERDGSFCEGLHGELVLGAISVHCRRKANVIVVILPINLTGGC